MAHKNEELIKRKEKIGEGGFGVVHFGSYREHNEVAIKDIKITLSDEALAEANILKSLTHRNIIQYIDIIQTKNQATLIMEFIDGGCLRDYIRRTQQSSAYWRSTRQMMLDVAYGMSYLHGQRIVHADLKSLNVLLRHNYDAVICDFGLARTIADTQVVITQNVTGTEAWFAPELCSDRPERSSFPSDVWAFGCVLLEMISQLYPWEADYHNNRVLINALSKPENTIIFENICLTQRAPEKLRAILCRCCAWQKTERPKFSDIVPALSAVSETDLQNINQGKEKVPSSKPPKEKLPASKLAKEKTPSSQPEKEKLSASKLAKERTPSSQPEKEKLSASKLAKEKTPSSQPEKEKPSASKSAKEKRPPSAIWSATLSSPFSNVDDPETFVFLSDRIHHFPDEDTRKFDPVHNRYLYKGPRGGWYYIGENGKKVYSKTDSD